MKPSLRVIVVEQSLNDDDDDDEVDDEIRELFDTLRRPGA
jgi:hypothetical protein